MRLLTCHINGFGKWQDVDFDFTNGVNRLCHENGWGKSTLAQFVRVMLFGFRNERTQKELLNERKRYAPWGRGTYGGELRFEAGGKNYILRRTFGRKALEDEFELLDMDTNLPSQDFSDRLGEELFSIDSESFMRTVFISQSDCASATTDSINAKIGNLVDNTDDINNFETADGDLKTLLDSLNPGRKTGSLKKLKSDIAGLELEVRDKEEIQKSMAVLEQHKTECRQQKKEQEEKAGQLEIQQVQVAAFQDLKVARSEYDRLCVERSKRQEELNQAEAVFKTGIPEKSELSVQIENCNELDRLAETLEIYRLSEEEKQELARLGEGAFSNSEKLSDAEWEDALSKAGYLGKLEQEYAREAPNPEEEAEFKELKAQYTEGLPLPETLLSVRDQYRSYKENQQELGQSKAALQTMEQAARETEKQRQSGKRTAVAGFICAAVFVLAGLLLAVAVKMILPAAVCFAVAVIGLGIGCLGRKKKAEISEENPELDELREKVSKQESRVLDLEQYLEAFCSRYGLHFSENEFGEQLAEMQSDAKRYNRLAEKERAYRESSKPAQIAQLKGFLDTLMDGFGGSRETLSYESSLLQLREQKRRYEQLAGKQGSYEKTEKLWKDCLEKQQQFLEQYGFSCEKGTEKEFLEKTRHDRILYEQAKAEADKACKMLEDFCGRHDVESLLESTSEQPENSMEELSAKSREISENLKNLQQQIQDYDSQLWEKQEQLDELQEKEETLEEMRQQYEDGMKRYQLLSKTRELLGKAKSSFTARYTEPIMSGFRSCFERMTGESGEQFLMDANTKLWAFAENKNREVELLSTGYQDLTGICLRIALVRAMYTGEKPFLILDDPFVNLDSPKKEMAMQFLDDMGREYQILYFTCHEES